MNAKDPRDRIYDKMVDTERMSRYYARRARALESTHLKLSFVNVVLFLFALASYQADLNTLLKLPSDLPDHFIPFLFLFASSVLQAYLLQFSKYQYSKASTVMSLQAGKLVDHWRKLWIDYENGNKENLYFRIETLEDQTRHIAITTVPSDEKTNEICNEEAKSEFSTQFGEKKRPND